MYAALSDPYLRLAFWGGVTTVLLSVLIVFLILYLRLNLVLRQRREQAFLRVWRPILMRALSNSQEILPSLLKVDEVSFFKLWNYLHCSLRGEASTALNLLARRLQCEARALEMLKSRDRAKRLLAILSLGQLREGNAWDGLVEDAQSADGPVSINALHALVKIDAEAAARLLTPLLLQRADWQPARIAGIVQEARSAFSVTLLEVATHSDSEYLLRALRLIEALRLAPPPATLLPLLGVQQANEIICAALRVTGSPQVLVQVRRLATHGDWTVRVQVARTLGRIGERCDVDLLAGLLKDEQWWVRFRAAKALVALPFLARAEFDSLRDATTDRYAHDMLDQVFAEGQR